MISIDILCDDRCHHKSFQAEHGLAFFIRIDESKYLFDAGQSSVFLKNAAELGLDLKTLDGIFLSHGDYDHGNGLPYLEGKYKLICHPACFEKRISRRTGKDGGLSFDESYCRQHFELIKSSSFLQVSEKLFYSGQIPRLNDFEKTANLPMNDLMGRVFPHLDDSALYIKDGNSLIIISACAHSGICNTIDYAMKMTACTDVKAVIGGFHLKKVDEQTIKTAKYLKERSCSCYLAHCTSDEVCDYFKKELNDVRVCGVSQHIEL